MMNNYQNIYNIGPIMLIFIILSIPVIAFSSESLIINNITQNNFTLYSLYENNNINFIETFPFNITFNPSSINMIENTTKIITIEYPLNYKAGTYNGQIIAISDNDTVSKELEIIIPEIYELEVNNTFINNNMNTNNKFFINGFHFLPIKNIGNSDLNIKINSSCENLLTFDKNLIISSGKEKQLFIEYIILQNELKYDCNMTFKNSEIYETININFTFNDTIKPEISRISTKYSIIEAGDNNTIIMNISDNIKIATIDAKVIGEYETFNMNLSKTETGFYEGWFISYIPGNYKVEILVLDTNNNSNSNSKTINLLYRQNINYTDLVNFYVKEYQVETEKLLFNFREETPVNISLLDIFLEENQTIGNFTIKLYDELNDKEYELTNNSLQFTKLKGKIFLRINSSVIVKFNGILKINTLEYVDIPEEIRFIGKFAKQSEFEPLDMNILGITMHCESDSNTLKPICTLTYPSNINIADLLVPMTIQMKNTLESQKQSSIKIWEEKYNKEKFWKGFYLFILIMIIISYIIIEIISKKYVSEN